MQWLHTLFPSKEMDEFLLLSAICKGDLNLSDVGLCGGVFGTWALNWRISWSFNFNILRASSNSLVKLNLLQVSTSSEGVEGRERRVIPKIIQKSILYAVGTYYIRSAVFLFSFLFFWISFFKCYFLSNFEYVKFSKHLKKSSNCFPTSL